VRGDLRGGLAVDLAVEGDHAVFDLDLNSRGLRNSRCVRAVVAASRTALAGLPCLSELSPSDVAASLVRRPLLAVVFGHEVFRRPVCFGPASEAAPSGLGPSQGTASRFRVPASPPRPSPPGVSRPFDDTGSRVRCPRGLPTPGTFRPRGFSPPRRFTPRSLRGHEGRCRPWGSHADPRPLRPQSRDAFHVAVGAPHRDPLPQGFRSSSSEEQEVRNTETPDRSRLV
jgi:hypothetical protein